MTITVTLKRDIVTALSDSIRKRYNEVPSGTPVIGSVYIRDTDIETLGHPEYIQVTLSAVDIETYTPLVARGEGFAFLGARAPL